MSRNRIKRILRIRAIDQRAREITELNIGQLNHKLIKLRADIGKLEQQYRQLNDGVDRRSTKLNDLTQLTRLGETQQEQTQQIEGFQSQLERQRQSLLAQLREQQVRIDQWDRMLEKLEQEVAATESKRAYAEADEAFLASQTRTQS